MKVFKEERGWGGHFICCDRCLFRRHTRVWTKKQSVNVSTVGLLRIQYDGKYIIDTVGCNRHFETMIFLTDMNDKFLDADTSKQVYLLTHNVEWSLLGEDKEIEANQMHEDTVKAVMQEMKDGCIYKEYDYEE